MKGLPVSRALGALIATVIYLVPAQLSPILAARLWDPQIASPSNNSTVPIAPVDLFWRVGPGAPLVNGGFEQGIGAEWSTNSDPNVRFLVRPATGTLTNTFSGQYLTIRLDNV